MTMKDSLEPSLPSRRGVVRLECLTCSIWIFSSVFLFVVAAVYSATYQHPLLPASKYADLKEALKSYKKFSNGSLYFEKGENKTTVFLGDYFVRMMATGEMRYDFGATFWNFCYERDIPPNEWMFSIFRTMQLQAFVQVYLRACVVCTLLYRLFVTYILINQDSLWSNRSYIVWKMLSVVGILNELIHYVALCLLFCYNTFQDNIYQFLYPYFVPVILVTLVIKHVVALFSKLGVSIVVLLRLFIISFCIVFYNVMQDLSKIAVEKVYCDQFVPFQQVIPEIFIGCSLLLTFIIDAVRICPLYIHIDTDMNS